MAETTTDAYQRRRRLLLEVSRVLTPAQRAADVDAFLEVVDDLPATDGSPELLAAANRALQVAHPLLMRAIVGEFDHMLPRKQTVTELVDLREAVSRLLLEE
jgi:hypothetical protein